MKRYAFRNPKFLLSGYHVKDFPKGPFPELALVGRSNVGKSSLLNHLFRKKGLAKTSSTPGKTQAINFFMTDDPIYIADLPGYGFAKVPKSVKEEWGALLESYLTHREHLKLLLFLLDSRRMPSEEDLKMWEWISYHNFPTIVVFTKVDKLKKSGKKHQIDKICERLGKEPTYVLYSVTQNEGRETLSSLIRDGITQ